MGDEWEELRTAVRDTAEGYAATDRANAGTYRQEAAEFAALDPPADAGEFAAREALAETLRRRWASRMGRRNP